MDDLGYDGLHGYWVHRILRQIHSQIGVLIHTKDHFELLLETGHQVRQGLDNFIQSITQDWILGAEYCPVI